MGEHIIVTVARQCGSGGREIGVRMGELLGVRVYDKETIARAAEKSGVQQSELRRADEKAAHSLLFALATGDSLYGAHQFGIDVPAKDQFFIAETNVIKSVADSQSAVFVGRCADYVLRHCQRRISCFIYADIETRICRVCEREHLSRDAAAELIRKTDKKRMAYYRFYTGQTWGKCDRYHLCVDSALLGVEGTAQLLSDLILHRLSGEIVEIRH